MKTDHIRNVVLLAKYFYKHTDSIIADVQKAMELDGFKFKSEYPSDNYEDILSTMVKNYDLWRESLEDECYRNVERRPCPRSGYDENIGIILEILSIYRIYVPMDIEHLGVPTYDKDHQPQNNVKYQFWRVFDDDKAKMERAKKFLSEYQLDIVDTYMNRLMDSYDWKKAEAYFGIKQYDLEKEVWEAYDEYVAIHEGPDGIENKVHHIYTKHFSISIDVSLGMYIVDMNTIIYHTSVEKSTKEKSVESLIQELWHDLPIDYEKISLLNEHADQLKHLEEDNIKSFFDELGHELFKYIKAVKEEEMLSTGAFEVRIVNKGDTMVMELRMETNYGCDARENCLFPYSYSY